MRVVVEVESGPRQGGRWLLRAGDRMSFGRTEGSDIIIADDPVMSSRHFQVSVEADGCRIEDLNSTNGTWIDGQRVSVVAIQDGTRIKAGNSTFVFTVDARDAYKRTTEDAHALVINRTGFREPSLPDVPTIPSEIPKSDARKPQRHAERPSPPPAIIKPPAARPTKTSHGVTIELSRVPSGLWRGVQVKPIAEPLVILEMLTFALKPIWVVDFSRTGLPHYAVGDDKSSGYMMANLPPSAAAIVSPIMIQTSDDALRTAWVNEGWGSDGMFVVMSHVDVPPMLEHFQRMMRATTTATNASQGMLGLCWPSILEATLKDGKAKLAGELIEPCEAILVDSPDSLGGWALYGDDRLAHLLSSCNVQLVTQGESSVENA